MKITEVIKAIDGGCVSEIEFLGPDGNIIGYWAYGYYDPQYPYQGNESIMDEEVFKCPSCESTEVAVAAEQLFMVNTGDFYCHSVKTYDCNAREAG